MRLRRPDLRLPQVEDSCRRGFPGTTLLKTYKGRDVQVRVLPNSFEFEGEQHKSLNLRLLAPDLQEQLLTFPRIEQGRDTICLGMFQTIALEPSWKNQREQWKQMNGAGQFASSSVVAG